jgi:hypoxanthine phosphoribosyltransferase
MEDDIERILINQEEIQVRVRQLGAAISKDYDGRKPLLIGALKGVVYFLSDLLRAISIPVTVDLIAVSQYAPGKHTGAVRFLKDLDEDIRGRDVVVVEDVVDTGLTLGYILRNLRLREPASLVVCTLFERPRQRLISIPIAYKGFDLPNCFVVGYGLDYREEYRQLRYIGVLKEEVLGFKQNCE